MKRPWKSLSLFAALVLALINTSTALAVPPQPSSFYGTVKYAGANVPVGTLVTARIHGTVYASKAAFMDGADTVYFFDVPGDDFLTTSQVEGGVPGDIIIFYVGTEPADQTATWQSGTNIENNLTVTPVYGLSVTKTGSGSGRVTSLPAGIDCGSTCIFDFSYNTSVTLTPNPTAGSTFTGWAGACSGSGGCTVDMTSPKSVTVNYALIEYTLTIISEHGTVTKTPNQVTYHLGEVVNLSAVPSDGWIFEHWSGDISDAANPIDVTINGNMTITAEYTLSPYRLFMPLILH